MDAVPQYFELLITIVEQGGGKPLASMLASEGVPFSLELLARGTARNKVQGYFGIGDMRKDVVVSVAPANIAGAVVTKVSQKLRLDKPSRGIMFSIRINSTRPGNPVHPANGNEQKKGGPTMNDPSNSLLMIIMNHGYADDVMDTALEAGAPGGTVMRAHGAGFKHAEKFLGITIQPDKDILMIVAEEGVCAAIMASVIAAHGAGHEAHAVAFTLPIQRISGLSTGA